MRISGSHSAACTQIGRLIDDLGHQRGADHDEAGEEHDEDGGPVAGIGEAIIEPADLAARPQRQKARNSLPLPQRGQAQDRPARIEPGSVSMSFRS